MAASADDIRSLRPFQVLQALNSTAVGKTINERSLRKLRESAGYRVVSRSDNNRVDLLRLTAWLADQRHVSLEPVGATLSSYDAHRERMAKRAAEMSLSGRDIGPLHEVKDPDRKEACRTSFKLFCETYFPDQFSMKWSPDHIEVLRQIEETAMRGGQYALAMPRGSGKTTMLEIAILWVTLYGWRKYAVLIGAAEPAAEENLDTIKIHLSTNELLAEDFPEVCYPIARLDGIAQRAKGQLLDGVQTRIDWQAKRVTLPTIEGAESSGAIIVVTGITGRIRGMKHTLASGKSQRPDFVLVDDPQTDDSARSPSQCNNRERVLAGAVLGLAGPGKAIAAFATMTVVCEGDMADAILDREKHPEWRGVRKKLVYEFPIDHTSDVGDYWETYTEMRKTSLRNGGDGSEATKFYRANREDMDAGAVVAWEARYDPAKELSAVQHAMNLLIADERAFWSEYQNEPLPEHETDGMVMTPSQIASKVNNVDRRRVPHDATHLTAFIDVQGSVLFYMVCAWNDEFSGGVIDYGTFPDQRSSYFTLREIKRTLGRKFPKAGREGQIFQGLTSICDELIGADWRKMDGTPMQIGRCLIDAGWGESTDSVYQFCRESKWKAVVLPSHGRGVGASQKPLCDRKRKPGETFGLNWEKGPSQSKRGARRVIYDTNFWKSFVHARLQQTHGDLGSLSLFGKKSSVHRMVSEHLASEIPVKAEWRGRTVFEWKLPISHRDNHWLDCLVGAAVAASELGVILKDSGGSLHKKKKRERVKLSEMQKSRRVG